MSNCAGYCDECHKSHDAIAAEITGTDIPAIERERDQAFIALTNVGGALVDAGSIEVPATVQDYGEAVRVLIGERDALQRDFSQELSAHRQTLAELELARGEHASDRNRFENVLSNLHAIARDVGCDRRASIGLATSAVRQLRTERDAARVAVDKYKKELATAWTDTEAARASEKVMGEELCRVHEDLAAVGEALRDILSHAWVECNAGRDVRMLNPVPVDRVARWRAALAPPAESRVCLGCGHFKHSNPCNCGCTMRPISPSDVYSSSRAGDMSECQSNMYSSRMCQRGTKSCTVDHAAREGK